MRKLFFDMLLIPITCRDSQGELLTAVEALIEDDSNEML